MNKEELIKLNQINLSALSEYIDDKDAKKYFLGNPGEEHYKLLAYFSTKYNNSVLYDIGTYKGCSALALSFNKNNTVKSYDIGNFRKLTKHKTNVEWVIGDFLNEDPKKIQNSPFIMLDIDHTGKTERAILDFLVKINWHGILMLDDIHLNQEMEDFWSTIKFSKKDITSFGHYSGTGLVLM